MVAQLLPDRPEIQILVMDQHFPDDPFQQDEAAEHASVANP
jgi:hypothetical protein